MLVKWRSKTCKTQKLVSWKIWISWDRTFVHGTLDLVPWPSVDINGKFYRDCPRGTPPPGGLNARVVAKYSDFEHLSNAISRKGCKIGAKLVLITNRTLYMSFWLASKSVTLNDLERRNGPILRYFTNSAASGAYCVKVVGWRYT